MLVDRVRFQFGVYGWCLGLALLFAATSGVAEVDSTHDIEVAPEEEPTAEDAGFDKRLVFSAADDDFTFQPIGLVQPLFTLQINSDDQLERLEGSAFSFRRAAIGFNTQMFDVARVFVVANLASGTLSLWDYFLDLDFWDKTAVFRMGRFRPFFGRQRLASAPRFQMVQPSRALTGLYDIGDGRDLGAGLFGCVGPRFEYGIGVWNGEWRRYNGTADRRANELGVQVPGNFDFQTGGRLAVHVLDPVPLGEEADLSADPTPRLTLALAAMYNPQHDQIMPITDTEYSLYQDQELQLGFDGAFKRAGFSVVGEFFARKNWLKTEGDAVISDQFAALGLGDWGLGSYLQAGLFLWPRTVEVALRFDYLDNNIESQGFGLYPAGTVNYYFKGYNLRAQLMYVDSIPVGFGDAPGGFKRSQSIYFMLQAAI